MDNSSSRIDEVGDDMIYENVEHLMKYKAERRFLYTHNFFNGGDCVCVQGLGRKERIWRSEASAWPAGLMHVKMEYCRQLLMIDQGGIIDPSLFYSILQPIRVDCHVFYSTRMAAVHPRSLNAGLSLFSSTTIS